MGKRFYKEDLIEKCGLKFDTSTINLGAAYRVRGSLGEYDVLIIDVSDTTIECVYCNGPGHTQRIQYGVDQFVDGSIKFIDANVNIVNTGEEFRQDVLTLGKCYSISKLNLISHIDGVLVDINKSELIFGIYSAVKQVAITHIVPLEFFDDGDSVIRELE